MNSIFLTGASGFVGSNLSNFLSETFSFVFYSKDDRSIKIEQDIVIHLAGKAHDLKKTISSEDYYKVNTELSKKVFDAFLASDAKVFITLSSVKAVADKIQGILTENVIPNPITDYGKSKLLAEQYILSATIPNGKRVYILRPCMIHGPGNKGNLNLLYNIVRKGIPYPLAAFDNKRSFLSIENLCFAIHELIKRSDIDSGVYNICDDESVSTNAIIEMISTSLGKSPKLLKIPKNLVRLMASVGDILPLPLNSERLQKMTENYLVNNEKLKKAIQKPFPVNAIDGFKKTIESFKDLP